MRSSGRRLLVTLVVLLILAGGLLVADRVTAAITAHRIAQRLEQYGFAPTPHVTVEGFPFLTQLAQRQLDAVDVSGTLRAKGITAQVHGRGSGIKFGTGSHPTVVSSITATGLVPFSDLATLTHASNIPGLHLSAAGQHRVTLSVGLGFITLSGIAAVSQPRHGALTVRLLSTPDIPSVVMHLVPASLLAHLHRFTVGLPQLPLGLTWRSVTIVKAGALVTASARNVSLIPPKGSA